MLSATAGERVAGPPGDVDGVPDDAHPWRAAIGLGLIGIAAAMIVSIVVPDLRGRAGWWIPADAWISLKAAHYVPGGTYPLIYETGTVRAAFDAGPLLPLLLAPIAALGDLFRLQESSYSLPLEHPSMWLLYGPYAAASAVPLLYAVRALATQLGLRRGRLLLQWAALVLAFVPMAIIYGHFEDVLALALVLVAFRDVFAGRSLRGALLLAAAIAFKQWSILAVPVFVVACPPALRRRAVGRAVGLPVALMGAFLAADYKYAAPALLHPPAFPGLGHAALWIAPSTRYLASTPTRLGAVVVAVLVAWWIRRDPDPSTIVSALGVVLLCRFLFEPVVHAYYLAPGILVLLLAETSVRRIVTNAALAGALVAAFAFYPDRWLWWIAVYALIAILLSGPVGRLLTRAPLATFAGVRANSHRVTQGVHANVFKTR